jgi:MYXO-CTERM domain-containing protein
LFGPNAAGEIIASSTDPNSAFYQWLYESYNSTTCGYAQGPPTDGHRWNILMNGPAVGYGLGSGASVGDFGGSGTPGKLVSGSHYPRSGSSVDAWANWYDTAGPMSALINVDGSCTALALGRGAVTNGAYHAALSGLASGCHRYFFLFHDSSGAIVTYPTTGSLGIGPSGSCADWDSSRPATGSGCACTPQCSGKQCGDDGCGGSCGNCGSGESCDSTSSTCVAAGGDAGATGGGDGGNGSNGAAGDAGTGAGGSKSGCGCATGGHGDGAAALVWAGVLALVMRRRDRR